jgi:hypothetical protein
MFKSLRTVALNPWGIAAILLVALPPGRKILRKAAKVIALASLSVADELKDIVGEVREESEKKMAKRQQMTFEPPQHECKSMACKCVIPGKQDYCNDFCKDVETSTDIRRCGCGHNACDITKQLGNEPTFDRTTG